MNLALRPLANFLKAQPDYVAGHLGGELTEEFIRGVYLRRLAVARGTVIVGKEHATLHMCIVAKGELAVYSAETGPQAVRYKAGDVWLSSPGAQRALIALEDSVFINVHSNPEDETDPEALERLFIVPNGIGYEKVEVIE